MAATRHPRERAVRTSIHAWRLTPLEFPRSVHGHGETHFDLAATSGLPVYTKVRCTKQIAARTPNERDLRRGPRIGPRRAFASTPCLGRESTPVLRRCQIILLSRKVGMVCRRDAAPAPAPVSKVVLHGQLHSTRRNDTGGPQPGVVVGLAVSEDAVGVEQIEDVH